jgi:hypothetical protein
VTGKPTTFAPIIGTTATTAMAGNTVVNGAAWANITDKPSTFAPIIGTTATTAMAGNTAIPQGTVTGLGAGTNTTVGGTATVPTVNVAGVTQVAALGTTTGANSVSGATIGTTGTLPVSKGGTGSTANLVQGGVKYASSTTVESTTAAGTAGQVLSSNGTAAPTWVTPTVTWDNVSSKPTTFAPIIGTTATTAMAGNTAVNTATWANVSGKPARVTWSPTLASGVTWLNNPTALSWNGQIYTLTAEINIASAPVVGNPILTLPIGTGLTGACVGTISFIGGPASSQYQNTGSLLLNNITVSLGTNNQGQFQAGRYAITLQFMAN